MSSNKRKFDEIKMQTYMSQKKFPFYELEKRLWKRKSNYPIIGYHVTQYECNGAGCSARFGLYKDIVSGTNYIKRNKTEHYLHCNEISAKIIGEKGRQKIIEEATTGDNNNIFQLYTQMNSLLCGEGSRVIASKLGSFLKVKRKIKRIQRKKYGNIPRKWIQLQDIPYSLTRTIDNDRFLLSYTNYQEPECNNSKVMIYATDEDLLHLFSSLRIFVDGTFKITPLPFSMNRGGQFFTIGTMYGDANSERLYRRVGILIPKKSKMNYKYVLRLLIIEGCKRIKFDYSDILWESVTSDFEISIIFAFQDIFKEFLNRIPVFYGCFFHYCKAKFKN